MKYRLLFSLAAFTLVSNSLAWAKPEALSETPTEISKSQKALRVPTPQEIDSALTSSAHDFLEKSSQITLFSLVPSESTETTAATPIFHGYEILGKVVLSDSKSKTDLLASFYEGLSSASVTARCFAPRHGIRAVHDSNTVDLLICFECRQFNVYVNGKQVVSHKAISPSPQPAFNAVLTAAKVPISP